MTPRARILVHQGTFAVFAEGGDIAGGRGTTPCELFLRDARHLSRWQLTANGQALAVRTGGLTTQHRRSY